MLQAIQYAPKGVNAIYAGRHTDPGTVMGVDGIVVGRDIGEKEVLMSSMETFGHKKQTANRPRQIFFTAAVPYGRRSDRVVTDDSLRPDKSHHLRIDYNSYNLTE